MPMVKKSLLEILIFCRNNYAEALYNNDLVSTYGKV
jgi:hypothetical protein